MKNIKTYDFPFNYLVYEKFFEKKDIKYILKMKKIFYKYSENVQEKLKNKKISNKRNILRFIDKNKIQFSKNKDIIKLSSKVKKAIKEKFDKSFFRSLNIDHTLLKKGSYNISICWDKPGYSAKPHTDTKRKIWSGILYLFGNGKIDTGTTILIKKKKKYKKFIKVKAKTNRLFAFKRSPISFHSVEKSDSNRVIILINFNYKNKHFK